MKRKKILYISLILLIVLFFFLLISGKGKNKTDGKEPERGYRYTQKEESIKKKNPVLYDLPYENSHFKIEYEIIDNKDIRYTITLYGTLNRPSQYNSYVSQVRQYKEEALIYLTNSGVDVAKAKIQYNPDNIQ